MKVVFNRFLPPGRRFAAINLFGVLFARHGVRVDAALINHEAIHTRQMRELGYLPFYIVYVLEWLRRLVQTGGRAYEAYHAISFEKEAYRHGDDLTYLSRRRHFAQWRRREE